MRTEASPSPGSPGRFGVLDLVGLGLLAAGAWEAAGLFRLGIGYYDEGILLSHASFIFRGLVPHTDFYANYPPGSSTLVAGLWLFSGVGVMPERWLGVVVRVATIVLAGRLGGRVSGRAWSPLAAGLVAAWAAPLSLPSYAWPLALALAFLFVEQLRRALDSARPFGFWLAGCLLGLVGACRHDLFGFLVLLLPGIFLLAGRGSHATAMNAARVAAGAAITLLLVFTPVLATGGLGRAFDDLVVSQFEYVLPHRYRSLPRLLTPVPVAGLSVPAILGSTFQAGVLPILAAPFVAAALAWTRRREKGALLSASLLGMLTMAVVPQMTGRPDRPHVLYCVAPALCLAGGLIDLAGKNPRRWVRSLGAVLLALLVTPYVLGGHADHRARRPPEGTEAVARTAGVEQIGPQSHRSLMRWLARNTGADERVFFGLISHESVNANEVVLYFMSDRLPATRYAQFDPGLTTRAEVQEEMIKALEARRTRFIVLSAAIAPFSGLNGSRKLDEYISSRYSEIERFEPYVVLQRNPGG